MLNYSSAQDKEIFLLFDDAKLTWIGLDDRQTYIVYVHTNEINFFLETSMYIKLKYVWVDQQSSSILTRAGHCTGRKFYTVEEEWAIIHNDSAQLSDV